MHGEDNSWISELAKGDKIWCAQYHHGEINSYKKVMVKTINKDTVSIIDMDGHPFGCFYKSDGSERCSRSVWGSTRNYILNPQDEKHKELHKNFVTKSVFCNLHYKVVSISKASVRLHQMEELSEAMRIFLDKWDTVLMKGTAPTGN